MKAIKAYSNCDHAFVVWRYDERIPECRGFALYRRLTGGEEGPVYTWVGFEKEIAKVGETHPSTEWPIQRFTWADLAVRPGQEIAYRVVPMVGEPGKLQPAEDQATDWTEPVTITGSTKDNIAAYFNRGIVSAQWLSRRLGAGDELAQKKALGEAIAEPGNDIRNFLAGELRTALLQFLADADTDGAELYAALFELNDPELLAGLGKLGGRAHVVLANGATKKRGEDENEVARAALREAGVEVHDRMLRSGHLGHNKFVVTCKPDGTPHRVWTGSTNWTTTGLCTQANNALVVESEAVGAEFKAQWERLRDAGGEFPDELVESNGKPRKSKVGGSEVHTWFTPVLEGVELEDARELIDGAKRGILFLMFNPGPRGSLLNDIVERNSPASPTYDPDLYVHGVLNQDPSTTKNPIVGLFQRGRFQPADFDITLPGEIDDRLGFWTPEIDKAEGAHAIVHSKVVVVDAFTDDPVVITGSHNLGPRASTSNDENLLIVRGCPDLAADYAINIMAIYTQFRWRSLRRRSRKGQGDEWTGLWRSDEWQDRFFDGPRLRELEFWLGQERTPDAEPAAAAGG